MTVRVAYSLNGQDAGEELDELQSLTALLPMGFGDDMLRFNGIGERITLAMNNNPAPSDEDKERYYEIVQLGGGARADAHDALGPGRDGRIICSKSSSA